MSNRKRRRGSELDYTLLAELRGSSVDPWHSFVQLIPHLVEQARDEAVENAASWRGFKVGAAMIAISSYDYRQGIIYRANSKPNQTKSKVCSEKRIFGYADKRSLDWPIGLVVTGKPNVDHGSGLQMPTLHPCEECRELIKDKARPDTLIMTVDLEDDRYQLMTAEELIKLHQPQTIDDGPGVASRVYEDPGFQKWENSRSLYGWLVNGMTVELQGRQVATSTVVDAARIAITGVSPEPQIRQP